ncbi:phosphatase PAP2 family protein [Mannheimia sp. AT1]|uniref:undecaprenyl-diphosphate phosphatase n=1 Tax=Mannheimia cairinae TaxID=3025936 RepID=A0ABT5MPU2_9PAST|nr:phosphatase PAP2 family protein [Mannheimia cairinae]MDD0822863.1 phosphatase PAP2 family protein [Mannheimia cairinae]MDD0826109.1 phosphatase PAP2 family protein [Mannheimia cairinae]
MVKKFSFYTFIMLLIPITTWMISWQWASDTPSSAIGVDYFLFLLTETGSVPYAAITCVIFSLILAAVVRKHYSPILVILVCVISMVSTQAVKSGLKSLFEEPRPFVAAMFPQQTESFYQLSRSERSAAVFEKIEDKEHFLTAHHVKEVGFSFPSGHTIFAVSWLLLFAGFCMNVRTQAAIFLQIFATLWAALMLISRLRLGMHYPIDLFVSSLIAWFMHLVIFLWLLPKLECNTMFKKH